MSHLDDAFQFFQEIYPDDQFNESLDRIAEDMKSQVERSIENFTPTAIILALGEEGEVTTTEKDISDMPGDQLARELYLRAMGGDFFHSGQGAPIATFFLLPVHAIEKKSEIVDGEEHWFGKDEHEAILIIGSTLDMRVNSALIILEPSGNTFALTEVKYQHYAPDHPMQNNFSPGDFFMAGVAEEITRVILSGETLSDGSEGGFNLRMFTAEMLFGEKTAPLETLVRDGLTNIATARRN